MSYDPQQLLPKPPRLKPDGSGYDWREFDRYLVRLHALLGLTPQDTSLNIIDTIDMDMGMAAVATEATSLPSDPFDIDMTINPSTSYDTSGEDVISGFTPDSSSSVETVDDFLTPLLMEV